MTLGTMLNERIEAVGTAILDVAFEIHREFGPGLLESVYKTLLAQRLSAKGHSVQIEKEITLVLDGVAFKKAFVADLIIDDCVIIEVKSVERMNPVFRMQLLTYLRLTKKRLGYVLNFKVPVMKAGITRVIDSR